MAEKIIIDNNPDYAACVALFREEQEMLEFQIDSIQAHLDLEKRLSDSQIEFFLRKLLPYLQSRYVELDELAEKMERII